MTRLIIIILTGTIAILGCNNSQSLKRRVITIGDENTNYKEYECFNLDSCHPLLITRNSINDSIAIEIKQSGTKSTAILFYFKDFKMLFTDQSYCSKEIKRVSGNPTKFPILDLTSLPDEIYAIHCLECGDLESLVFSIKTLDKKVTN